MNENKEQLRALSELYHLDYDTMAYHMPEEGFDEYFNFLQTLAYVKGNYNTLERDELEAAIAKLEANPYGYPTARLRMLLL